MMKKRETVQAGIADWAFVIAGLFLIGWQIYKYTKNEIENYGLEVVVFCVGLLFLTKPQTLTDAATRLIKKKSE